MQLRSVANDWYRWQLKQKFAIAYGKTKAVDVNPPSPPVIKNKEIAAHIDNGTCPPWRRPSLMPESQSSQADHRHEQRSKAAGFLPCGLVEEQSS